MITGVQTSGLEHFVKNVPQTSTVRIVTLRVGIARITMFAATLQDTVLMVVSHSGRETGVMNVLADFTIAHVLECVDIV